MSEDVIYEVKVNSRKLDELMAELKELKNIVNQLKPKQKLNFEVLIWEDGTIQKRRTTGDSDIIYRLEYILNLNKDGFKEIRYDHKKLRAKIEMIAKIIHREFVNVGYSIELKPYLDKMFFELKLFIV